MELKSVHKRIASGILPDDWSVVKLGYCLSGVPDYGVNAPAVPYSDSLPKYIRITDITEEGSYSEEDVKSVLHKNIGNKYLDLGDLVFARTGASVGKSYLYNPDDGRLVFAGFLIRVKPDTGKLDPRFLAAYVQTGMYWKWVNVMSMRSGQPGINSTEYCLLPIPLPSLPEQHAIAEVLGDVDALIAALDHLIAKKRAIKQGAMQELLTGKKRLPGFSGEWEMLTLGELEQRGDVKLYRGEVISQKDINRIPGDYPIYSSSIHSKGLFGCYGEYMFDEELITWSVDGGGHFFYRPRHRFSVTNVCGYLRIHENKINYQYLAYHLQALHSHKVFDYTLKAHPSVIRKAYDLMLPTLEEQIAIAKVLYDMDAELDALEARREKTRALKQGLMQELLTGRTRVL